MLKGNELESTVTAFRHYNITPEFKQQGKRVRVPKDNTPLNANEYLAMANASAAVFRLTEHLPVTPAEISSLVTTIQKVSNTPEVGVHLYVGSPDSVALPPHDDPYPVVVVQTEGCKTWTVCPPSLDKHHQSSNVTEAELALKLSGKKDKTCGDYTAEQLRSSTWNCRTFTLHRGDFLVMPARVPHYATACDSGSAHLTIGLHKAFTPKTHDMLSVHAKIRTQACTDSCECDANCGCDNSCGCDILWLFSCSCDGACSCDSSCPCDAGC
eukprot:TRINITY_DN84497_c0_g1_i1.p1 TRINITY_DN84497_c0_g1~~TRINITY_DN84497_c0_g1_i1.p1  ORF type:complete len:269 (+),score=29.07 TRINITY_DN84497_c0_g1_i1:135-941(+)